MKNARGISLMSLVITIVVIIILAGISIFNGINKNITETGNTMDYNEVFDVSNAVSERSLLNRLNSNTYQLVGQTGVFYVDLKTGPVDKPTIVQGEFTTEDGWYKITETEREELNLEKVRKDYLVNYSTGEVIPLEAITYEDVYYQSSIALNDAIAGNKVISGSQVYDDVGGVNKPYVVTGMIPVKWYDGNWVVTTTDDPDWYDYSAPDGLTGNRWANIMLVDEMEVQGLTNAEVRTKRLQDLKGKQVTKEGSMFVWIPRYSVGIIDGKTQVVYSVLTQDYFKESDVLSAFVRDGIEQTGIWVSKYDASYIEK